MKFDYLPMIDTARVSTRTKPTSLAASSPVRTTHRRMVPPYLYSKRSFTGNHVLLPSHESRMMNQEVLKALDKRSFASWSLGRYTVVTSRLKTHLSLHSLANFAPKSFGRFGRRCSATRSSLQVEDVTSNLAFRRHSPSTHAPAVVYMSLQTEFDLSIPGVLLTVLVRLCWSLLLRLSRRQV